MMMDHHRFIKPSNTSNVMIGGAGSRSANSDTTDEFTARDPATADDFDYANAIDNYNNNLNNLNGRSSPTPQSSSLFGDDAFDKINVDFDSIMASNDLDTSNNLSSSYNAGGKGGIHSSDTSVNSEMLLDKLNAELGATSELKGIGHSPGENSKGKLGDIGDELDMDLLDALMPNEDGGNSSASVPTQVGEEQQGSDSTMDQLLKSFPNAGDGKESSSDDASIDKLLNIPIIDMEKHSANNANNTNNKSDSNTANINLSLKKVDSTESLCDSMASLPSIGHISPNASFANIGNAGLQASMQQQMQQQQQAMLLQQQQQLQLQQQMQQQQQQQQHQNISVNNASIQSIVNDQLSHLPQANELTRMGVDTLEQEKMKLINRLQAIENKGQQEQQQQQQQLLMQKQLFLQQQNQLQQQQQQQFQQQSITTASSMPSLSMGGQMIQGQMQIQGQQQANNFAFNQQMMQQQQQGGIGQGMMSQTPMNMNNNMNMNNGNNNSGQLAMQSSMFANTGVNNNNSNNNAKKKNGISSIMGGLKGKDTPLFSFLRNRKRGGTTNSNNMMSMTGKQQQQLAAAAAISPNNSNLVGASNHSNSTSSSGILDAAPIDFSNSSNNPFLRKQMMNNLDKSVNRMNSARGRLGGGAGGRGLSSAMRRNMMQQMSTTTQLSKSCKELRRNGSSDSYESAGIIVRVSSADHIPSRRASLTAGAAKAQNRRFTLNRSNNSLGNLTKTKSGSRRELNKGGGGSSSRSLPGGGSSTRSLNSNDSQSSLIPIKRRGSMSGGRGGHGAKHKLGSGGGSARRISSVPYMGNSFGDSASALQQRMDQQQNGPQHNDGWP